MILLYDIDHAIDRYWLEILIFSFNPRYWKTYFPGIEKNHFQYYWSGLIRIDFFQYRILRVFVLAQLLNNGGIVVAKSIQQLRQEDLASNVSSHGASIDVFVLNSQFVSTSETKKE